MKNKTSKWDRPVLILYIVLYLIISLSMIFNQPFGNPPDEANRDKISLYIAHHHALPNGYDEEIRIPGYGFSYGFQPILPYMIQGGVMIIASNFVEGDRPLLYAARLTDCVFGLIMALFVWKLSKKWFKRPAMQYLFSYTVMFLPQSLYLHTYINTESCAMLSTAIILYAITCCLEDDFSYKSCGLLSVGVILCALSYYNAYGFVLGAMMLFVAWCIRVSVGGKASFDGKSFVKKGGFICIIVLAGIAWWFIRSAILYDGDFLGLRARALCGEMYKDPSLLTLMVPPYKEQGYSLFTMFFKSDFWLLTVNSSICSFGAMDILTNIWVYRFFKALFFGGLILFIFVPQKAVKEHCTGYRLSERPTLGFFYHVVLIMCAVIPIALSVMYSYQTDYQPQGRYILPALLPVCYYVVRGVEKGVGVLSEIFAKLSKKNDAPALYGHLITWVCVAAMIIIAVSLIVTTYWYAFPRWERIADLI